MARGRKQSRGEVVESAGSGLLQPLPEEQVEARAEAGADLAAPPAQNGLDRREDMAALARRCPSPASRRQGFASLHLIWLALSMKNTSAMT